MANEAGLIALLITAACSSEPGAASKGTSPAPQSASAVALVTSSQPNPKLPPLRAGCERGEGERCFALAEELRHEGTEQGVVGAYQALVQGCKTKHQLCCAQAAWYLAHGVGVKANEEAGHRALEQACTQEDNPEACLTLYSDWAKELEEIEEEPRTPETDREKAALLAGMTDLRERGTKLWASACTRFGDPACDRLGTFLIAAFLGRQAITLQLDRAEQLARTACPPSVAPAGAPTSDGACSAGCRPLLRLAAILRGLAKENLFSQVPPDRVKAAELERVACTGGCATACSPARE